MRGSRMGCKMFWNIFHNFLTHRNDLNHGIEVIIRAAVWLDSPLNHPSRQRVIRGTRGASKSDHDWQPSRRSALLKSVFNMPTSATLRCSEPNECQYNISNTAFTGSASKYISFNFFPKSNTFIEAYITFWVLKKATNCSKIHKGH